MTPLGWSRWESRRAMALLRTPGKFDLAHLRDTSIQPDDRSRSRSDHQSVLTSGPESEVLLDGEMAADWRRVSTAGRRSNGLPPIVLVIV